MRFGATGAVTLALLSVAPARASDPVDAAPPSVRPTERAASDAVGIFCVPVLIAGRLPAANLIAASNFTRGTQPHAKPPTDVGFSLQVDHGDLVEVFVDEAKHGCTVHIHGGATAIDDYRTALRAQNWQQVIPPAETKAGSGILLEAWRVRFNAEIGGAIQFVGTRSADATDPDTPQVNAGFLRRP